MGTYAKVSTHGHGYMGMDANVSIYGHLRIWEVKAFATAAPDFLWKSTILKKA